MLLERDIPLQTLSSLAERAAGGQGRVAFVSGESGIGKTSLLREFASRLDDRWQVLWGGCEALFTPQPLGPLHDIASALGARIATMLDNAPQPASLFSAVLDSLADATTGRILIFEDVHWADYATLDLVKYLSRRIATLRCLMVLSARADEIDAEHPLIQVLGDIPSSLLTRVALNALSPQAVAILARPTGHSAEIVHHATQGNPFFVTELLASPPLAAVNPPASVRDAVWARLARLSDEARRVLEAISVAPGGMEAWLAQAILGGDITGSLDYCLARGMLMRDDEGVLRFRHELARLAVLERLSPTQRRQLHACVLAALDATSAKLPLSRLIHHAAAAADGSHVLVLAPQAAAQAAQVGAHREAVAYLSTALCFVAQAPPELAAQLYQDWAYENALTQSMDDDVIAAHHRAIELWRTLGRRDKVGHNLRCLSRLHWERGEARLAEDYAEQTMQELEGLLTPTVELAMAYGMRTQLHMLHRRRAEAVAWGERTIALATQLGDVETRIHALNSIGTTLLFASDLAGKPYMEESLELALEHGFHEHVSRAYTNYSEWAVVYKDFVLAERLLQEGIAFENRHDLAGKCYYQLGWLARLRMDQGQLRQAHTIANGVIGLNRLSVVERAPSLRVISCAGMRLGLDTASHLQQRFLETALAIAEPQYIVPAHMALAEAAWLAQDSAAGTMALANLAQMDTEGFNPWELAEFAVWRRRIQGDAVSGLDPKTPPPYAAELRGDPLDAAAKWRELGLPYEEALALIQVRDGDAPAALARAIELLDAMQARPAAARARTIAHAIGIGKRMPKRRRGPYAAAREHPYGITRRELQVLRLLASGMANVDIAQRLSRSPRTVELHVSSALRKLGADSRVEVMLRLGNEPWLLADGS